MHRSYGIAGSFALHAVFALTVLWPSHAPETPAAALPPPPLQVLALSTARKGSLLDAQESAPECSEGRAYVGIGLQFNLDQVVIVAPESYPAYKAGIRVGDAVLNPNFAPDPDGYEIVDFTRHRRHLHVRVKTQWICLR